MTPQLQTAPFNRSKRVQYRRSELTTAETSPVSKRARQYAACVADAAESTAVQILYKGDQIKIIDKDKLGVSFRQEGDVACADLAAKEVAGMLGQIRRGGDPARDGVDAHLPQVVPRLPDLRVQPEIRGSAQSAQGKDQRTGGKPRAIVYSSVPMQFTGRATQDIEVPNGWQKPQRQQQRRDRGGGRGRGVGSLRLLRLGGGNAPAAQWR